MKTENSEHPLVNGISCKEEQKPMEKVDKWARKSIVGNIGFDIFSAHRVNGFKVKRKFLLVNNPGPEVDSYMFWSFIWEKCCTVIVRLDETSNKHNWLNNSRNDTYTVGEFVIWKKTDVSCKYYTQLEITIENIMERKSIKVTHLQYHGCLEDLSPERSTQLILLMEIMNKHHVAKSKESASGPIVIHSIGCFERAVSICVLDICLDQLMKTNVVSVLDAILTVKSKVSFDFNLEEYNFIEKILECNPRVLDLKKARSFESELGKKSLLHRFRKFSLSFRQMSLP